MEEREQLEEAKDRARVEARKQLMKEVDEARQLQLQAKKKQRFNLLVWITLDIVVGA